MVSIYFKFISEEYDKLYLPVYLKVPSIFNVFNFTASWGNKLEMKLLQRV